MRHLKLLITLTVIITVLAVPLSLFFIRAPVLVVTDASFAALYGVSHLKRQQVSASFLLFRRVKPVMIADGASHDIVILAILEVAKQPCCILFPRSQASAAMHFHEQFPGIPTALLSGLIPASELPFPEGFLCVYGTDRETDLYRAGILAGILGNVQLKSANQAEKSEKQTEKQNEKQGKTIEISQESAQKTCLLWQDRFMQVKGRELFSDGVREVDPELTVIFANSINDISEKQKISCAVLTDAGAEYLEKSLRTPVILFSWMDPAFATQEIVVLFDDSVWALAVPAARMAASQQAEGRIPSKPLIFSEKVADNGVFRVLKKSAKKMP